MAWYESWKTYVILGILVPVLAIIYIISQTSSAIVIILGIVGYIISFPLIMLSLYMWVTGKGKNWINGINWSKYSESQCSTVVSRTGFVLFVMMEILLYGLSMIIFNTGVGIALIVVSIVIPVVFVIAVHISKRNVPDFVKKNPSVIAAVFIAAVLLVIPCCYILATNGPSSDEVEVTINETSIKVTAPFFDHTFQYDKIDDVCLKYNFDRGSRISGNASNNMCSGTWENNEYGRYELAIDPRVDTSISILYEDHRYVFNLKTSEKTVELYDFLVSKT